MVSIHQRNRNTAILLIGAGLFILVGNIVGFFTIVSIGIIWLGIHKVRTNEEKTGYVLLAIGGLFLLGDHFTFVLMVVLLSLGYYYLRSREIHRDQHYIQRQKLMESMKWNRHPWELKSMSAWSLIGEIQMDLSLALPESSEITLNLQGIIGDVDLIIPEEIGVDIRATVLFGQIHFGHEQDAGFMNKMHWRSPNYEQCEVRVNIITSHLIGDVDMKWL
ncbi:cell wall-active antibiotics response protein LiaF [Marinicrinis sediminis]|uniref:Cell wall-active antibiotics response protein LiaF n=1 Tax=Marinicrinis sediminis TaxID=1652465 RepID=A0ABW5RBV8_9BACL